jgi:uncharacterized repeat protein (TIGR01451 family)
MKGSLKRLVLVPVCLLMAGCCAMKMNDQATMRKYDGKPCYQLAKSNAAEPKPVAKDGTMVWYLPIENPAEAVVKVTSYTPTDVMQGVPFEYKVTIENISGYMLDEVVVSDVFCPEITIQNSTPAAKLSKVDAGGCTGTYCDASEQYTKAQWFLGCIESGGSRTITASAVAGAAGSFAHCIDVAYIPKMCQEFMIISPKLDVDKVMPAQTLIEKAFPVEITVWNDGSGLLKNVQVTDTLPDGLIELNSGSRNISFTVDELVPGQPRKYTFQAKAVRTGLFTNTVVAAAGMLKADDSEVIKVIRPMIAITKDGPASVSLGREVAYRIVVSNKGDAPVQNLAVTDIIPPGSAFVSASDGGVFQNGIISWNLGTLQPGKSRELQVKVRSRQIGTMLNRAEASATDCPAVRDDAQTIVEGVAALLMEVVDSNDPVLIGDSTTYTITIRNQGTSPGRNIVVKAFLEDEQDFVSATGASQPVQQGASTTFAPVTINPGASAVWTITVRANAAGDIRFKSIMSADGFERPVEETESTTLY